MLIKQSTWKKNSFKSNDLIVVYLFGELACPLRRVENLVVENGEVECESESDGMRWLHLGLGDFKRLLIRLLGVFQHGGAVITGGDLGKVPVQKNKK